MLISVIWFFAIIMMFGTTAYFFIEPDYQDSVDSYLAFCDDGAAKELESKTVFWNYNIGSWLYAIMTLMAGGVIWISALLIYLFIKWGYYFTTRFLWIRKKKKELDSNKSNAK